MVEPVTINLRFLSRDLGLPQEQVQSVVTLLDNGFPVPFIARYRKDQTGNLDEEILRIIEEELKLVRALCERKQAILKTLDSQGKLTPELDKKIRDAKSSRRLEDLYLPFKPKRQTLASEAREHGLEPLALEIFHGTISPEKLDQRASEFINEDKKIKSIADALLGAGYIIAEMFSEKIEVIQEVRDTVLKFGKLVTTKIEPKPQTPTQTTETSPKSEITEKSEKKSASKKKKEKKNQKTTEITTETSTETSTPPETSEESEPTTIAVSTEQNSVEVNVEINENTNETCSEKAETETVETESIKTESVETESTKTEFTTDFTELETVIETDSQPVAESNTTTTEHSELESPASEPQKEVIDADAQAVTEQFQQWKEAQEEQGIPIIRSQNSLKKKNSKIDIKNISNGNSAIILILPPDFAIFRHTEF
jgi:uncharacterized protein